MLAYWKKFLMVTVLKNDSGHPVLIYDFNGISPIVPNIQIILEMF